jgi:septal ring factor EnvC (AmiA/AmiB activator)
LDATQSEVESTKQAADQAKVQAAELEQRVTSLNSDLQKADGQRIELQEKLEEAESEIERLTSELEQAKAEGQDHHSSRSQRLAPTWSLTCSNVKGQGQSRC